MTYVNPNNFGDMLRMLRRRVNLTQAILGQRTGYSTTLIARLESNTRRPNVNAVCTHFVSALELIDHPELSSQLIKLASEIRLNPSYIKTASEFNIIVG